VFDKESHKYLEQFEVPFIKIACETPLYEFRQGLSKLVKKKCRYYMSVGKPTLSTAQILPLCCVPKYPATLEEYEDVFGDLLGGFVSDHTIGLDLYNKHNPAIWEKHFYMDGLESYDKEWAVTPEQLGGL
jgi:sialic acid synthase SpsE